MINQMKKLREEAEKLNIPQASLYLIKTFGSKIAELENSIAFLHRYAPIACGEVTTNAGSTVQEFSVSSVKPGMHLTVQMCELGATPVQILAATTLMGKIKITFSADPGADHKLAYKVCK